MYVCMYVLCIVCTCVCMYIRMYACAVMGGVAVLSAWGVVHVQYSEVRCDPLPVVHM